MGRRLYEDGIHGVLFKMTELLPGSEFIVNRRWNGTPYRHPKGTPLIGVFCW